MKVGFYTLGCKVNKYETDAISQQLKSRGYSLAEENEKADIVVVNSCTVTSTADAKSRQAVRRFKRDGAVVVMTGCVPQAYPEQAIALTEADVVVGNRNNNEIFDALDEYFITGQRVFRVAAHKKGDPFVSTCIASCEGRTRAVVKIQDGCDRFCSYCVIPISRGRIRSKPLANLENELHLLSDSGYKEVVFAGINLSSYGRDIGLSLYDAVRLSCDISGIERVRLGSLEPDHMTDEMIQKLSECKKLCPQFHISLQSGCDATLKRMNRHYDSAEYESICKKLRSTFADCTLTTDVMVGFPGESESEFSKSLAFVKHIGFEKVHVFPYSPREGTRAAGMDNQIEKHVKQERCRIMIEETEKIREAFFSSMLGQNVKVLLESKTSGGFLTGFTENYVPVKIKAPQKLCGTICSCIITGTDGEHCIGEASDK